MLWELISHELGSHDLDVEPDPEQRSLADGDVAILRTLAVTDEDCPAIEVAVSQPQRYQVTSAQPTGVEDLEDRSVSQSERPGDVRCREQARHLRSREHRLGKTTIWARDDQIGGRIRCNALLSQPCPLRSRLV